MKMDLVPTQFAVPTPNYSTQDKYSLVAQFLEQKHGTILDLGARDKILQNYLDIKLIKYKSCDVASVHDYAFDLEQPIPLADQSFDFVAALDVLEHLENTHLALAEMMRITSKYLFVTLPNMSSLGFRMNFLVSGWLSSKYELLPEHQGDRHRWLTVYPEIYRFIYASCEKHQFAPKVVYNLIENKPGYARLSRVAARMGIVANGLFTHAVLFVLERQ